MPTATHHGNITLACAAMGTRFELVLAGSDPQTLRDAGEEALARILELDRQLSFFRRDSLLSHINAAASYQPVRLDQDLFDLFTLCDQVHTASDGAFDPTIAPLMRHWGFRDNDEQVATHTTDPAADPAAALEAARSNCGWRHITLNPTDRTIAFRRPGIALDLGGIAKGFALDQAAAILRESGIDHAFLHGGTSTITTIGPSPDGQPWRVWIDDHADKSASPRRWTALLDNASLSVSAPSGRTITRDGQKLGHILDPRTGRPAATPISAAAVITDSAAAADAWSTALLVLGEPPASIRTAPIRAASIHGNDIEQHIETLVLPAGHASPAAPLSRFVPPRTPLRGEELTCPT